MVVSGGSPPEKAALLPVDGKDDSNPDCSSRDVEAGMAGKKTMLESVAKFANQNQRFKANAFMAVSIASYMTVFGLPVYSEYAAVTLFGQKDEAIGDKVVTLCGPNMMGPKVNIGTEEEPHLVNFNRTLVAQGETPDAWCGFLPGSYFGMWPTVVMTAMFTLYGTTGSTVKNAWQCLSGTFFAVLNLYFMTYLYPMGAKDENYSPGVAWLDLTVVVFLFLASRADTNTMMMGMCSTVCLMLHFMDPNTGATIGTYKTFIPFLCWDGETAKNMATAVMGCTLAVVATLFPRPLLNITRVHEDAEEIIKGINSIFKDSIEYYCGDAPDARRFQIFGRMSVMDKAMLRVDTNLRESFWETFNLGKYSKIRELYGSFHSSVRNTEDVMYAVKASLIQLSFAGRHKDFVKELEEPLGNLHTAVMDCLEQCAKFCKDGRIDDEEQKQVLAKVQKVKDQQADLSTKFLSVANKTEQYIDPAIAPDSLFIFSISQWAGELSDWAEDLASFEKTWRRKNICDADRNICALMYAQLKLLFDPFYMFSLDRISYFAMNAIPILAAYAISMYADGTIFVQYSSIMPSTLALLVTDGTGSNFFINLQKLMGVTFGRTLPLLVMSVIDFFPCSSYIRFGLHATSIFAFYSTFTFMYYSSESWSTIGIMIAAFGCGMLFRPCSNHIETSNAAYASHYKGIAEVIVAMMLKMICEYAFRPTPPRDIAVKLLKDLFNELKGAFQKISEQNLEGKDGVVNRVKNAKAVLAACEAQAPKTDSKLEIVPGLRTPFKKELYEAALVQARLLISDLDMLTLALHGHVKKHTLSPGAEGMAKGYEEQDNRLARQEEEKWIKLLTSVKAWTVLDEDIGKTIDRCFATCMSVLEHDTENKLEAGHIAELRTMSNLSSLDGLPDYYREVSDAAKAEHGIQEASDEDAPHLPKDVSRLPKTRILLAVNALDLATQHSAEIAAKSFQHMLYM